MTPVTVNTIPTTAMVDTGANPFFISKEFCVKHAIPIILDTTNCQVSRGGLLEEKHVTVTVTICNGTQTHDNFTVTICNVTQTHDNFTVTICNVSQTHDNLFLPKI
jgi:hypothetical protein